MSEFGFVGLHQLPRQFSSALKQRIYDGWLSTDSLSDASTAHLAAAALIGLRSAGRSSLSAVAVDVSFNAVGKRTLSRTGDGKVGECRDHDGKDREANGLTKIPFRARATSLNNTIETFRGNTFTIAQVGNELVFPDRASLVKDRWIGGGTPYASPYHCVQSDDCLIAEPAPVRLFVVSGCATESVVCAW